MEELRKTWDKYTKGPLGSIIYLVLGFLIAFGLNAILGFALSTDTPVVAVFSESMLPTYYKGDMVIVKGDTNISNGDIIVFDVSDRTYPIIHRVYAIEDNQIRTKGDNNQYVDPWTTTQDEIHGKAVLRIPFLGWVKIIFTEVTGIR